jgi:hypothetical protein
VAIYGTVEDLKIVLEREVEMEGPARILIYSS